jgi:Na+/H+ antiporter NhaC
MLRNPCHCVLAALLLGLSLLAAAPVAAQTELAVEPEGAALSGGALRLKVTLAGVEEEVPAQVLLDGAAVTTLSLGAGEHEVRVPEVRLAPGRHTVEVRAGGAAAETELRTIPGWLSIVPPLAAIALALLFKDVLIALFLGVFLGALFLYQWNPLTAFARSIDSFVLPALADTDHASIIVFSTLLGGMVGLISKSGGTLGIVDRLAPFATTARRGQVATWLMGLFIFFDDYANTLIVGSTMRPITDRLRVSREKLAYIVDATAAPVASIVPISTWIGFEIGLIAAAFNEIGLPYNAYTTFIASIPYRFYPILALVLGFTIAFSCRDFGPMLRAERRASSTGKVLADDAVPLADYGASALTPPDGTPRRAFNAILPILTVVGVTILGLYATGSAGLDRADHPETGEWLREVFANANSYTTLMWASLAGVTVALLLPLAQRILTVRQATDGMVEGFKAMLLAMVVLTLAWSLGGVAGELHTADYVVRLTEGVLSPHWLPVLVFLLSAAISFATGTSWGTMGILMPLVIPISHGLSLAAGHPVGTDSYYVFLLGTISSVLAGSVWGDHCSPISDTTILSSMGSGCDHIAHVKTQLPYAFSVGVLGMLLGDIPTAYGLSPWLSIGVGSAVIVGGVLWLGKRSDWQGARE